MSSLPKAARDSLTRAGFQVGMPRIGQAFVSVDGTERYLVACADGETVETVWMPNGDDGELGDGSEAATEEAEASSVLVKKRRHRFLIGERRSAFPARWGAR